LGINALKKQPPDRCGYGGIFSNVFLRQHLDASRPFLFRISGQSVSAGTRFTAIFMSGRYIRREESASRMKKAE
jgi:hypothetical protein